MLFDHSEEGDTPCLGWVPGTVRQFPRTAACRRSDGTRSGSRASTPVTEELPERGHFYFVNSYFCTPSDPDDVLGITDYGAEFCSVVARGNIVATQFHAEKSGTDGPRAPARLRGVGRHMLTKRLIACFDVIAGRVTKAQQFQDNIDVAPAEELAARLYDDQIDEIVFYDITASAEKRKIDLETVARVAHHVFVPFTVGGGIRSVDDMFEVLKAGAEKISVDSMAVRNPEILREGAEAFGRQCIVLSTQVKHVGPRDGHPERLRGLHRRRAPGHRSRRPRLGAAGRGPRRR